MVSYFRFRHCTRDSVFWSYVSFKMWWRVFVLFWVFFFWGGGGLIVIFKWFMITCRGYWNQTKFPIHKVWWLREAAQIRQTFITLREKKSVKNTARQNCNRSSNFDCNWTSFHSKKFIKKTKNAGVQAWGDVCRDQKPETFFIIIIKIVHKKANPESTQLFICCHVLLYNTLVIPHIL